jgi:hypothetical protein
MVKIQKDTRSPFPPGVEQVEQAGDNDDDEDGLHATQDTPDAHLGHSDQHRQQDEQDSVGYHLLGQKQSHNIGHREQQLGAGIQPGKY